MPVDQFLNFLATVLAAAGAIYVLKSILQLTPTLTERLSATFFGHNTFEVEQLSSQKADSFVGAGLVLVALLIAMLNAAIGPSQLFVPASRLAAILAALLVAFITYLVLLLVGSLARRRHFRSTARIITYLHLDEALKRSPIASWERKSLNHFAYSLLKLPRIEGEGPEDLLRRIAADVGHPLPDRIEFDPEPASQK